MHPTFQFPGLLAAAGAVGEVLRDAGDVLSPGAADSLASCLTSELKDEDNQNRRCQPCLDFNCKTIIQVKYDMNQD